MSRIEQINNHLNPTNISASGNGQQQNNSQLWTGFHKKTYMERLDQVKFEFLFYFS